MDKINLEVEKRKITGRKVKQLRKKGIIPANIYGKKVKSTAVSVKEADFTKVYEKAGSTSIVNLSLEGKNHPVLIHGIQYEPVTRKPLHIDFLEVNLEEKITAKVPLTVVGESPAVKDKIGTLLSLISEVEVEALPTDLPEKIEVDVSSLSAVDQFIKVGDLKVSDKIKIITDLELEVVKVAPLISKEAEKMAKEEAEKVTAAASSVAEGEVASAAGAQPPQAAVSEKAEKPLENSAENSS